MFKKVLIANRGEIALRVIRACKELNIRTVAVYSEVDANSMTCADGRRSHLHRQRGFVGEVIFVLTASSARRKSRMWMRFIRSYGFLSENAHFAEVCESCNIRFIGPSPHAMNALGDKAVSRALAKKAGVETPPGSDGIVENEKDALAIAKRIGYPVMIKAVPGWWRTRNAQRTQ